MGNRRALEVGRRASRSTRRGLATGTLLLDVVLLSAATLLAAQEGSGPAPVADDRPADELLREVLLKRDLVDFEVFETLGQRRKADELRALQRATSLLNTRQGIDAVYYAFRHLRGADGLEAEALRFLLEQTDDDLPYRQRAAARALTAFGGSALDELLEVQRTHRDPVCRQIAVGGLVPMLHAQRTPQALAMLLAHYRPPHSGTRERGVDTFAVFVDEDSLELFEDSLDARDVAAQTKSMVVQALGRIGGEAAIELLVEALKSKHAAVQLGAVRALGALGHRGHLRQLARLERSKDPAVRHAAMLAQSELRAGEEEWRVKVVRAARVRDFAMRMAAASCLARLGDDEAVALLYGLLEDDDALVRRDAVRAVVSLRRADSLPLLVARMAHESLRLREELRAGLEELTGLDLGATPDRWERWWADEGETYRLPELDEVLVKVRARQERRGASHTQTVFYGIPIESDRVCFVLDVSGSMSESSYSGGMRIDAVKKELLTAIEALPDGAWFNLLFFDTSVYGWKRELMEMNEKQRASALDYASKQGPGGGTALYDALIEAFEDPDVDTIVLLSDGEPTEGKLTDPQQITEAILQLNELRDIVIHTVSVNWASDLLRELADRTGGTYEEVR